MKFLVELSRSSRVTHSLLKQVYGDECLCPPRFLTGTSGSKKVETRSKMTHVQDNCQQYKKISNKSKKCFAKTVD